MELKLLRFRDVNKETSPHFTDQAVFYYKFVVIDGSVVVLGDINEHLVLAIYGLHGMEGLTELDGNGFPASAYADPDVRQRSTGAGRVVWDEGTFKVDLWDSLGLELETPMTMRVELEKFIRDSMIEQGVPHCSGEKPDW